MRVFVVIAFLLFRPVFTTDENGFEATSLFEISANSSCGDPPTNFGEGEFNCSFGEHLPPSALDNDFNTWWQSGVTDYPVTLIFTLNENKVRLDVVQSILYYCYHYYYNIIAKCSLSDSYWTESCIS